MVGARDERIRALEDEKAALIARCEALAGTAAALELGKQEVEDSLVRQTATVTFLEATLQTERDTTGEKIASLTADLRHERLARAAEAQDAAAISREIAALLPKLMRAQGNDGAVS
jgi:hypothetical protein